MPPPIGAGVARTPRERVAFASPPRRSQSPAATSSGTVTTVARSHQVRAGVVSRTPRHEVSSAARTASTPTADCRDGEWRAAGAGTATSTFSQETQRQRDADDDRRGRTAQERLIAAREQRETCAVHWLEGSEVARGIRTPVNGAIEVRTGEAVAAHAAGHGFGDGEGPVRQVGGEGTRARHPESWLPGIDSTATRGPSAARPGHCPPVEDVSPSPTLHALVGIRRSVVLVRRRRPSIRRTRAQRSVHRSSCAGAASRRAAASSREEHDERSAGGGARGAGPGRSTRDWPACRSTTPPSRRSTPRPTRCCTAATRCRSSRHPSPSKRSPTCSGTASSPTTRSSPSSRSASDRTADSTTRSSASSTNCP